MSSPLLMDITRLLGRQQLDTPTGIDRVEFEYASHLLRSHSERLRFVVRWRGLMRVVSRRSVSIFLGLIEEQWRFNQSQEGRRTTRLIQKFLQDPQLGAFVAQSDSFGHRVAGRRLWRAKARMIASSRGVSMSALSRHGAIYVNVSHEGLHQSAGLGALVEKKALRPVFFIHDLIPITHPEYVKRGGAAKHHQRMATALGLGAALIVNSRYTRDILAGYARDHGYGLPPVTVAPLGSGFPNCPTATETAEGAPFFISLGTIEPRKNHIFLLQLWRQMVDERAESAPKLLLIGRRGWENENAIDLIERCPAIRSHVLECGCVSDDVLEYLMTRSRAVLFPSFAEGYGMPLIEAMALKTPVIASDLEVFREIGVAAPEFLNPMDGPGWLRQIAAYASPVSAARRAQLQRMETIAIPRWADHFAAFDEVIEAVSQPEPAHV